MIRLFDQARDDLARGQFDWYGDTFKLVFLDNDYVVNLSAHRVESDLQSGSILGYSETLVPIDNDDGYVAAEPALMILATFSRPCTQIVLTVDGGSLIAHIHDEAGLPVRPQGEDVQVEWAPSFAGIFRP